MIRKTLALRVILFIPVIGINWSIALSPAFAQQPQASPARFAECAGLYSYMGDQMKNQKPQSTIDKVETAAENFYKRAYTDLGNEADNIYKNTLNQLKLAGPENPAAIQQMSALMIDCRLLGQQLGITP